MANKLQLLSLFLMASCANYSCEFYYSDITMASFLNDKYGDITVESIP